MLVCELVETITFYQPTNQPTPGRLGKFPIFGPAGHLMVTAEKPPCTANSKARRKRLASGRERFPKVVLTVMVMVIHQGQNRWHSYHVLVEKKPIV